MSIKIAYSLPDRTLTNAELCSIFPGWTEEKILSKTGIATRHVVSGDECALDLAVKAARQLFAEKSINTATVDFLLLCTQSPKFMLPSTSCLLHEKLGLRKDIGSLAFDHGCSGFVYGLSLAKGLIAGGVAKNVLLVTAETYTKYIMQEDKSTRSIFGDGAAATLIDQGLADKIGVFSFGTDGSGADKLIVRNGHLFMDGPDIFNFTLEVVPKTMNDILVRNCLTIGDIDLFVFHQANKFMLDTIRKVNGLSKDKFYINMATTGNTVSSTIPIALKQLDDAGRLHQGMKIMLIGFGVGLSWGGTIVSC